MARIRNVLFICTANSARSILAEGILNHLAGDRFRAYSAGSFPSGRVHPLAIETLREMGAPVERARSKAWDEFANDNAPPMDLIFTVCDAAAGEACPVWPGHPVTAHWGVPDPAAVEGGEAEKLAAFRSAAATLRRRIELLASLPIEKLDEAALKTRLASIGRERATAGKPTA